MGVHEQVRETETKTREGEDPPSLVSCVPVEREGEGDNCRIRMIFRLFSYICPQAVREDSLGIFDKIKCRRLGGVVNFSYICGEQP